MMRLASTMLVIGIGCSGAFMASPAQSSRTVVGPSGPLRVDDGGQGGPPIVFVHGLGGDHAVWKAQLAHLRPGRRALAVDLHGFGGSARPAGGDYSIESMVGDLEAVIGEIPRVVLVGHSYGGLVIAAFAARHPDRVAGLLFVDPAPDMTQLPAEVRSDFVKGLEPSSYEAFIKSWFDEMLAPARPAVKADVKATLAKVPRDVMHPTILGMLGSDPKPWLAAYAGPKRSILAPGGVADLPRALHNLGQGFPHELIPGTSHWVMLDKPSEFNERMDAFLAELSAGGGP